MTKEHFALAMATVAEVCGRTISKQVIALYDEELRGYGYPQVVAALRKISRERGDRDPFPSIKTIREVLEPKADVDAEAILAANLIIEAIQKVGYTNPTKAKEFMGELAWQVVEHEGGWTDLCQGLLTREVGMRKAQWRDLAKSLQLRALKGLSGSRPALPKPERLALTERDADPSHISGLLPKRG